MASGCFQKDNDRRYCSLGSSQGLFQMDVQVLQALMDIAEFRLTVSLWPWSRRASCVVEGVTGSILVRLFCRVCRTREQLAPGSILMKTLIFNQTGQTAMFNFQQTGISKISKFVVKQRVEFRATGHRGDNPQNGQTMQELFREEAVSWYSVCNGVASAVTRSQPY